MVKTYHHYHLLMRQTSLLLFLANLVGVPLWAQQTHLYNPFIDVQHYEFNIEVNDLNNEIKADAVINARFLKATNTISFDLIGKSDNGKGMVVNTVTENGEGLLFEQTAEILTIRLKKGFIAGDTGVFKINYNGIPADGLVFSKNKFNQRTIFGDNWPNRARNWLPCVDHLSDKASVDFLVTAPDHYKVVSNGLLIEESAIGDHEKLTHWKETVELPTKVMVIGLADFAINYVGDVECVPVSSWVFPPDKKNGFYDYAEAMEILPFFIHQVGPYAYKKLANVEAITIFGGMENASAIFYSERSITGKRSHSEELLAHEIAHQWFGNSATESDWSQVWLSEGFATEMANLFLENKYGADTLKARLKADRKTVIDFEKNRFTPVVDSSENRNYLALLNDNSYKKGGWVLHMLRKKLGDSLFWKGIRSYYSKYAGKNASTDDFRRSMEEVSQINLEEFFQQWLYTAGHPIVKISWKYNETKKILLLQITQQQKQLFSFPLQFAFAHENALQNDTSSVFVKQRITQAEIPMAGRPSKVMPDPLINLLFESSIIEN